MATKQDPETGATCSFEFTSDNTLADSGGVWRRPDDTTFPATLDEVQWEHRLHRDRDHMI